MSDQTTPHQVRAAPTKPYQTQPNQHRPNQTYVRKQTYVCMYLNTTRPSQTRSDQARPDQTKPDQTRLHQTRPDKATPDTTRLHIPDSPTPDQTRPDQTLQMCRPINTYVRTVVNASSHFLSSPRRNITRTLFSITYALEFDMVDSSGPAGLQPKQEGTPGTVSGFQPSGGIASTAGAELPQEDKGAMESETGIQPISDTSLGHPTKKRKIEPVRGRYLFRGDRPANRVHSTSSALF